ncbi:MAG: hypothetical protein CFE43_17130 [Burkholderiales bacterium PBB3]|nr:MAG: hypothetical protein CFE43_17130 [Burkholderiales bacterium PBB3]
MQAFSTRCLGVMLGLLGAIFQPAYAGPQAAYVPVPAGMLSSVLSGGSGANAPVEVGGFAMRATPVTVSQYLRFTKAHPQWQRAHVPTVFADASYLRPWAAEPTPSQADQPITNVSWFAAQAFCESEGARLPTWYEWEYVAAADDRRADARKDAAWRAKILGWYSKPSNGPPNAVGADINFYGIENMHGLIWEWVDDFNALLVSADSRNQGDPDQLQYCGAGAISLQDRDNFAILMRVALLSSLSGSDSTNNLGFRCARSPEK